MDKNVIKKYAVWARRELIERVSQKALQYGITADEIVDASADSINGNILTVNEKKQRQALIHEINVKSYGEVMEAVAYTWFNRFSALRFMEVNGYLPSRVRVFTDEDNNFKPQIIDESIHIELDGLDMEKVFAYKETNRTEELYKYLLITQCNALSVILPGMFQRISDYTELLLPDNLLREGSVIQQMIELIPEDDWRDSVQIIGWLYQYYIAEPKDDLINARKQYKSKDIPFVTQLFTSDWIVRYLVENSLGRIWLEGHPDDNLLEKWKFYIPTQSLQKDIIAKQDLKQKYAKKTPEELSVIDPCCGSGHILSYMFDVLMEIYLSYGYTSKDAVESIVKKNIYGLDIDQRAAQLAYFSVMMKARQYDRGFLNRGLRPHVYAISGSEQLDAYVLEYFCDDRPELEKAIKLIVEEFKDAKDYGSILQITEQNWTILYSRFEEIKNDVQITQQITMEKLLPLVHIAEILSRKYAVVVTNPPYMSAAYMPVKLKSFVQKNYGDFKNDLFSVFTKRILSNVEDGGQIGLLMPYVWMFISSYEKMRNFVNSVSNITSLVQLEYNAFEAACVPVAAITLCKTKARFNGEYIKLSEFRGAENQEPKTLEAVRNPNCGYRYSANQDDFCKIPGAPMAYWVGSDFFAVFKQKKLGEISRARRGLETGNNNKYIRYWYEVNLKDIDFECQDLVKFDRKWLPHNKGGDYRTWFGNDDLVVWFENDGKNIRENGNLNGYDVYLKEGITWTALTSSKNSFRYTYSGHTFDSNKGPLIVDNGEGILYYLLAFFNSRVAQCILKVLNPTMSLQNGDMDKVPIIFDMDKKDLIEELAKENIALSKADWDSFETSYGFRRHPLIGKYVLMNDAFLDWDRYAINRFNMLKQNEEVLDQVFTEIYHFENSVPNYSKDKEICIRVADLSREIRSFISYAVGCMLGRYSLDVEGLAFAGGEWDASRYCAFPADGDNIIPICDDEYFDDDIVGRFIKFVEIVFGEETLQKNLQFIADALDGKGQPKEVIRRYFLNEFFKDHCKTYQKRPIYWLFDSGRKNGFKALIYMHRYQPDTIARIRTDYVHEQQSRYRTAISEIETRITDVSTSDRVKLNKELKKLQDQAEEIRIYEEKIHHLADQMISIDLDDGVKHNYEIFKDVLAKIK